MDRIQKCVADIGGDAVNAKPYQDLRTACEGADIIVTVSMAKEPIVKGEWLKEGTVILSEPLN